MSQIKPAPESTNQAENPLRKRFVVSMRVLKWLAFGLISAVLGLFSMGLIFLPDLAPGESIYGRLLAALIFFIVSGFIVGWVNPEAWGMAGIMAWGGMLMGVSMLLSREGSLIEGIMLLTLPVLVSLAAGYAGFLARHKLPRHNHNHKAG